MWSYISGPNYLDSTGFQPKSFLQTLKKTGNIWRRKRKKTKSNTETQMALICIPMKLASLHTVYVHYISVSVHNYVSLHKMSEDFKRHQTSTQTHTAYSIILRNRPEYILLQRVLVCVLSGTGRVPAMEPSLLLRPAELVQQHWLEEKHKDGESVNTKKIQTM